MKGLTLFGLITAQAIGKRPKIFSRSQQELFAGPAKSLQRYTLRCQYGTSSKLLVVRGDCDCNNRPSKIATFVGDRVGQQRERGAPAALYYPLIHSAKARGSPCRRCARRSKARLLPSAWGGSWQGIERRCRYDCAFRMVRAGSWRTAVASRKSSLGWRALTVATVVRSARTPDRSTR